MMLTVCVAPAHHVESSLQEHKPVLSAFRKVHTTQHIMLAAFAVDVTSTAATCNVLPLLTVENVVTALISVLQTHREW
jgi:hypothetical protein